MDRQGREDSQQGSGWRKGEDGSWLSGRSHIPMQINLEKQLGSQDRPHNPQFLRRGNKALKPLTKKTCEGCGLGRNSQTHRRVCWRDPLCPRMYTNPPTGETAPKGPNLLVGSGSSY